LFQNIVKRYNKKRDEKEVETTLAERLFVIVTAKHLLQQPSITAES